ncbi:GCN5-related N-acetyltransferase [Bifidobacterium actinocoloniiforme DSM 22766]|uniref:GCN5-related N-acetyltransferase n=1 Tax=Bifidobacterium actinocoloniiforme DSM 22766 TaxID=1437605 RepID=A0A086Z1K9_9BIFI|nr:GNAT family N-acetyltransferase [Bifidobacterium actinocoloniiforme]AKV55540.1 hypothetical protein AB656_04155 [Bifidobacterium actinocoloniiforme DSM 22766]KFI40409.1 GCN5-related N-acetyltransferase [Bifidobacterium actinocoloniiforme DSM 22766]
MGSGVLWDRVVKLDETIELDKFLCGESEIDIWLQKDAWEQQEHGSCTVYVALGTDGTIIGFFSLNMYYLQFRALPEDVKPGMGITGNIPCVLLGRLGVNQKFRHGGRKSLGCDRQGPLLLKEAIMKARSLAENVGCRAMYVQALNEDLVPWYRDHGFHSLPGNSKKLVRDLRAPIDW